MGLPELSPLRASDWSLIFLYSKALGSRTFTEPCFDLGIIRNRHKSTVLVLSLTPLAESFPRASSHDRQGHGREEIENPGDRNRDRHDRRRPIHSKAAKELGESKGGELRDVEGFEEAAGFVGDQ